MAHGKASKKARKDRPRTKNARFAALIRHVKKKRAEKTSVRLFRLSKKILNEGAQKAHKTQSPLGTLPQELFVQIAGNLSASGLICLSLTSKAFAHKTASLQDRMAANLCQSLVQEPGVRTTRGFSQKALASVKETRALIGRWLGRGGYRYCHACEKFRPSSDQFWYELFETKTPPHQVEGRRGIGRGMVENFPKQPDAQRAMIEDLLDKWNLGGLAGSHAARPLPTCPAHVFGDKLYGYAIRE